MLLLRVVALALFVLLLDAVCCQDVPGYASANSLPLYHPYPALGGLQNDVMDPRDERIVKCAVFVPGPSSLATQVVDAMIANKVVASISVPNTVTMRLLGSSAATSYNSLTFITRRSLITVTEDVYIDILRSSPYAHVDDKMAKSVSCVTLSYVSEGFFSDILAKTGHLPRSSSGTPISDDPTQKKTRRRLQQQPSQSTTVSRQSPFNIGAIGNLAPSRLGLPQSGGASNLGTFTTNVPNTAMFGMYPSNTIPELVPTQPGTIIGSYPATFSSYPNLQPGIFPGSTFTPISPYTANWPVPPQVVGPHNVPTVLPGTILGSHPITSITAYPTSQGSTFPYGSTPETFSIRAYESPLYRDPLLFSAESSGHELDLFAPALLSPTYNQPTTSLPGRRPTLLSLFSGFENETDAEDSVNFSSVDLSDFSFDDADPLGIEASPEGLVDGLTIVLPKTIESSKVTWQATGEPVEVVKIEILDGHHVRVSSAVSPVTITVVATYDSGTVASKSIVISTQAAR